MIPTSDHLRYVFCPYHPAEEPTLAIDMETGRYHCHICGAAGMLTPHGETKLLLERRGRNPVAPDALQSLEELDRA